MRCISSPMSLNTAIDASDIQLPLRTSTDALVRLSTGDADGSYHSYHLLWRKLLQYRYSSYLLLYRQGIDMPRSCSSSCAYSGYRPKTIGGTSLCASSGFSPDFGRKLCKQTTLRLMCRGSHTVFIVASVPSCHAASGFTLTATLITSRYAIILTNMGGPTLCFRATTFMFGHFYK